MLERHEIARRFAAARARRVTLFSAPGGFGKSVALDAYVRANPAGIVRFDARRADTSLARFLRSLGAALHRGLPQIGPGSEVAFELAMQPARAADAFAERLAAATGAITIVLDELHHGETDPAIVAFLAHLIERCGANVRFILAVRSTDGLPLARWLADGVCAPPIDGDALALTNGEALDLGARFAPMLPAATILRLRDRTAGAAAVFAFVLRTVACDPRDADTLLATGGDAFARCADYVFARFTPFERTRLIESVVLPDLEAALLADAGEGEAWLAAVEERSPQIFRNSDGARHYTELFYEYLRERLEERGAGAVQAAIVHAAAVLDSAVERPAIRADFA